MSSPPDRDTEFREFAAGQMDALRGLAYLTCGDWQLAEDAVLGVLAKLYVRWRRVENPGAYARTAVVRAAIDETRRPWWRREKTHAEMPETAEPDPTGHVDERLRLRAALAMIPAKQRAVLVLRFLEGLSVRETAAALRCPEGTVKAYTSRGLGALRQILNERTEARHAPRSV